MPQTRAKKMRVIPVLASIIAMTFATAITASAQNFQADFIQPAAATLSREIAAFQR